MKVLAMVSYDLSTLCRYYFPLRLPRHERNGITICYDDFTKTSITHKTGSLKNDFNYPKRTNIADSQLQVIVKVPSK